MKRVWLLLFFIPTLVSADVQIKSFFPEHRPLIGQPFYWIVELRYPVWESYNIKSGPCPDLKIATESKKLSEVAGELRVTYRLAVIATALKVSCNPSVTISDEKGQSTVLSGKPVQVRTISGESEEIQKPVLQTLAPTVKRSGILLYVMLIALVALSVVLVVRRIYHNTPRQKFLRDIRKAAAEIEKGKLPIQVWRILRSQMVWGFDAESYTATQLIHRSKSDTRLSGIAHALRSLEPWRYSGANSGWDKEAVLKALQQTEAIVRAKPAFSIRRAA